MEKYTYEIINEGTPLEALLRSDGAVIPKVQENKDYQAYLESLKS